jgi:adenylosuccinate lyase
MIPRYQMPEMAALFTDEARLAIFVEIELLNLEAQANLGLLAKEYAEHARANAPLVDREFVDLVEEREKITDHDVAAFVDVLQDKIGLPSGPYIHHGLTSSDVVDTALSLTLVRAAELLTEATHELVLALKNRALEHRDTYCLGRTHGIHAEPTTFGVKLALMCFQVERDLERLKEAARQIGVAKLSGAVGTYSNLNPDVEQYVASALNLKPVPANQVIARDRHAQYLYAIASIGSTIESLATEIRHLQRSEVGEVLEPFRQGQKGSSAMPHKRNPILSERLVGMARVLRGYLVSGLENVALWHERDISHSSAERIILPDASMLAYYAVKKATYLVNNMAVNKEKMLTNLLQGSLGLVFSQTVLLSLVEKGLTRDNAYRIVQSVSMKSLQENINFRDALLMDPALNDFMSSQENVEEFLEKAFDLGRLMRNTHVTIDKLNEVL